MMGDYRQLTVWKVRFLRIAHGSACEVECQLLLSRDLDYLEPDKWEAINTDCRELGRMLNGLIRSLQSVTGNR
jgi:four helix bundle protein